MNNKPKVSIIMPVFKTEPYIEEAIQSVLEQSYPNIELLCVNDDTPDGAFEICRKYQKMYSWIKLVDNDGNRGLEYTRNHGLDEMSGEYVLFLDSDDMISSNMIEKMMDVAVQEDSDVVMSAYSTLIDGKDIPVLVEPISDFEQTMDIRTFAALCLEPIKWKILCCVGTKLYKAQIIRNTHLRFDKTYKYNEDGAFIFSFLLCCSWVSYINEPFYKYRIRSSGSIMTSYRPYMFQSVVRVNELLGKIFVKNHVFAQKEKLYYQKLLFIIIDSLRNEAKFGDKQSFRQVFQEIHSYEDFGKMQTLLTSSHVLGKKQRIVLNLMRWHQIKLLYFMLKNSAGETNA